MTEEQQIHAIERFGYTTAEARFLHMVALQGGYFLRRQILQFENRELSKTAQDFIEKLTDRKHACLEIQGNARHLYRLHFRPIYAALGQAKSRNRRGHRPGTIRVRLMALDFVLAHPEGEFLVTEQETVSYFLETQRIDPDLLPARSYCIKGRHLTRHFADGFPVFLRDDQPYSVSFCYIDDSEFSLAAFRSYLVQYRPLFKALGGAPSLYFVTQQQTRFEAARKMIRRFSDRLGEAEPVVDINRLLAHFPHRLLWERRDIKHLNTAQIHRLQDDLYTFSGPEYDHLFASWKQGGDAAVRSELAAEYDATPLNVRLSVHILEHDYDMLSNPQASSSQTFRMLNAGPTGDCAGQTAWSPT